MLSEVVMTEQEWRNGYLDGMTAQEWVDFSLRMQWLLQNTKVIRESPER